MKPVARAVGLVATLTLCGCSFLISDPLPAGWSPDDDPDCEPHPVAAAADFMLGVVTASYALCSNGYACPSSPSERAIPSLVAALFWTAAYRGITRSHKCLLAKQAHEAYDSPAER